MSNLITVLRRWWDKISPKIVPSLGRVRLTLVMFVVILVVGFIAEGIDYWPTIVQRYGWDLVTLQQGRIYAAWVGLFFSSVAGDFYGILILLLLTAGVLEYRRGTRLAAFGFLIIGPLASIITLLLLWPIGNAGIEYVHVALYTPDVGSSTACLVCLGIFLMGEKGRWRNIVLFGTLVVLAALFFHNSVYNIDHLAGFLIGIGTGSLIAGWNRRKRAKQTLDGEKNKSDITQLD
jgi:hypothetical protein